MSRRGTRNTSSLSQAYRDDKSSSLFEDEESTTTFEGGPIEETTVTAPDGKVYRVRYRGVEPGLVYGTAEYKRAKRLADNRASAARSRALERLKKLDMESKLASLKEQVSILKAENERLSRLPQAQTNNPYAAAAASPCPTSLPSGTMSSIAPQPVAAMASQPTAAESLEPQSLPQMTSRRTSSRLKASARNRFYNAMSPVGSPNLSSSSFESDTEVTMDTNNAAAYAVPPVAPSAGDATAAHNTTRPHRLPASIAWFMGFAMCMAVASNSGQDPARTNARFGNIRDKAKFNFSPPPGPDAGPSQWASWAESVWNTHHAEFTKGDFNTLQSAKFFSDNSGYSDPGFRANFQGGYSANNYATLAPNTELPLSMNDDEEEDEFAYFSGDLNFSTSLFNTISRSPKSSQAAPVSTPNLAAQFSRDLTVSNNAGRKRSFNDLTSLDSFALPSGVMSQSAEGKDSSPRSAPDAPNFSSHSSQYEAMVSLGNQIAASMDPATFHTVLEQSGWDMNNTGPSSTSNSNSDPTRDLATNAYFPSLIGSPSRDKDNVFDFEKSKLLPSSTLPIANSDPEMFIESPVKVQNEEDHTKDLRKNSSFDDFFVSPPIDQGSFKESSLLFSSQLTPLTKPDSTTLFDASNDLTTTSLGLSVDTSYDVQNSPKRQKLERPGSPIASALFSSPSNFFA